MILVGVDENGLGPRLGPLIATAITCEVETYDRAALRRAGRRMGVEDSKAAGAFGRMAALESIALAVVERVTGRLPLHVDELLGAIALGGLDELRSRCPSHGTEPCWSRVPMLPVMGGDVTAGRKKLARLERRGIGFLRAKSVVQCVRAFNERVQAGESKARIDLSLFERLLVDAREHSDGPITAICGMVGGIRKYTEYLSLLPKDSAETLSENRQAAVYRFDNLGEVRFEVDADDHHLPVALASIVGKYIRELLVHRQNAFYLAENTSLKAASGYHDPVTTRFMEDSRAIRERNRIDDGCFLRLR